MKYILLTLSLLALAGCTVPLKERYPVDALPTVQGSPMHTQLTSVPAIDGPKMTIGVYSFSDKTGQRKPADNIANLSSAVTQGAEAWVIMALQTVGNGTWFEVVERIGMDNVVKERQLIRSTRENYEKEPAQLKPLLFAGVILEGSIVGYDSNIVTGGTGARYFGIGATDEYRVDTVTVAMRLVSVNSGKVLVSVATQKTIASTRSGIDAFKFLDLGTKSLEVESGYSTNEPVNYAVRAAIEAGVIELIQEGARKELWTFKEENTK